MNKVSPLNHFFNSGWTMVFKVVSGADGNVTAMQIYDSEDTTEEFTFSAQNVANQDINIYMNRLASSVFWDSPYQVSNILSRTTKKKLNVMIIANSRPSCNKLRD